MPERKTDDEKKLLAQFKRVLAHVGWDISANNYDRLQIARPPRKTLGRKLGLSWVELKALAADESTVSNTHQALVTQNQALLDRLNRTQDLTKIFLDNCLAAIAKIQPKPVSIPKTEKHTEDLTMHAMRSDAHVGEYLNKDWVQGLSHYDSNTYQERVELWARKVALFREQDKNSLGLNKLIINFLGDQVTGESIYKGQPFYIDLNLTDQLFFAVEVESSAILALAKVFPEIEVFCVVGNHGRPAGKGQNHMRTNFDYIFYRTLKMTLEPQKNVTVYVSESPSMVVQHGNFNFLLTHGDAARGWMGIPFYGLERMSRKLPDLYGMMIHFILAGHHHQPAEIGDSKILLNGSLPGGSELSINKMSLSNVPAQKIFYFDDYHGVNRKTDLHLADPVVLEADEHGIFTAHV